MPYFRARESSCTASRSKQATGLITHDTWQTVGASLPERRTGSPPHEASGHRTRNGPPAGTGRAPALRDAPPRRGRRLRNWQSGRRCSEYRPNANPAPPMVALPCSMASDGSNARAPLLNTPVTVTILNPVGAGVYAPGTRPQPARRLTNEHGHQPDEGPDRTMSLTERTSSSDRASGKPWQAAYPRYEPLFVEHRAAAFNALSANHGGPSEMAGATR